MQPITDYGLHLSPSCAEQKAHLETQLPVVSSRGQLYCRNPVEVECMRMSSLSENLFCLLKEKSYVSSLSLRNSLDVDC